MAFSGAALQDLGTVLSNHKFTIPEYQRGYAWLLPQWIAIWQDLKNNVNSNGQQHFTGMMLLRKSNTQKPGIMEVVDGQQRLVTAMLLANALREKAGLKPDAYALTFEKNEDLQNHFELYGLHNSSASARLSNEPSSYALNIKEGANHFHDSATELTPEQAAEWLKSLLNNFQLFVLEVSDGFDIHIAFETLNNRGRRLSDMELLKNRLIYLTTVLQYPAEEGSALRDDVHAAWKGIYRALGRSTKTQNHDDEFLLAHATAYFKKKREAAWLSNILFDVTFNVNNPDLTFDLIRDYLTSLEVGAFWWSQMHAPDNLPKEHQKWLARLDHCGYSHFKPLLLAAYLRAADGNSAGHRCSVKASPSLTMIAKLLKEVERYIVVVFRLMGKSGSHGKANIENAAFALLRQHREANLDKDCDISASSATDAIVVVVAYLHAWVGNIAYDDGTFSDDRFKWAGIFDHDEIAHVIEQRFLNQNGYYKWDFTRLALYEYEESFQKDGNNPVKLSWSQFSFDETVEHIYPQNPEKNDSGTTYWEQQIYFDGRSNRGDRLRLALQNSLGNLLFLSRSGNASASNDAYSRKKDKEEVGKRKKFSNAGYAATEITQTFSHWNAQSIAIRGVALLKFIESRWDIVLTDNPDNLQSYLPLCFGLQTEAVVQGKAGRNINPRKLVASMTPGRVISIN